MRDVQYPVYASPKIDGHRCLMVQGKALSRSFKPIRNAYIRNYLEGLELPDGLDGELTAGKTFQDCSSAISSMDGEPDFVYSIFDYVKDEPAKPFISRIKDITDWYSAFVEKNGHTKLEIVEETLIMNEKALNEIIVLHLESGYEGTMIRKIDGEYKFGRSSLRERILLKIKPFEDAEGRIVGFEEMMHNLNEAEKDAFGRTKRSFSKEGKVPANTLGKFLVVGIGDFEGIQFDIGTGQGLTHELRQEIWDNQDRYVGKMIKYKYQKIGTKDLPREPIFLGFRDREDL